MWQNALKTVCHYGRCSTMTSVFICIITSMFYLFPHIVCCVVLCCTVLYCSESHTHRLVVIAFLNWFSCECFEDVTARDADLVLPSVPSVWLLLLWPTYKLVYWHPRTHLSDLDPFLSIWPALLPTMFFLQHNCTFADVCRSICGHEVKSFVCDVI